MNKRKHLSEKHQTHRWYRLDNAAKLYPAIASARLTTFFRFSVTLRETVNPELLEKALLRIIDRFPYYRVRLRAGFFWYYIEHNPALPLVEPDEKYPCMKLNPHKNRQFLFRVRYFQRRVAVEFCHVITDGTGGMIFFKTLLAEYYRIQGERIPATEGVLSLDEFNHEEEEDAYNRFYKPAMPYPQKDSHAYHIPGKLEKEGVYHVTTGIVPLETILAAAKAHSLSLTEFLVAIYLDCLQKMQAAQVKPSRIRPIRLSVPINLRKLFPSATMRNFSLYVTPGIDPRLGSYTFDEIARAVHHHMRSEINEKSISRQISRNVGGEKHFLVRIIPLILKKAFAHFLYSNMGEKLYSGSLSNLGPVNFPRELARHIEKVDFIPGPNPINYSSCSAISYNNSLYITFGRANREAELERLFFTSLIKLGIPVRVESNE